MNVSIENSKKNKKKSDLLNANIFLMLIVLLIVQKKQVRDEYHIGHAPAVNYFFLL